MPQRPVGAGHRFLTPAEAGAYLRVSDRTLENFRIDGGGPRYRKIGRMVRYTIPDLDAWVESRTFEMTSEPEYPSRGSCKSGNKS